MRDACRRWRYDIMSMFCVPRARRAGPVEGGRVRAGGAAMLRRVALRVPGRARRQRERLPARGAAASAGVVHGAPVRVRPVALPAGQGGDLLRADRAVRAPRRRLGCVEGLKEEYAAVVLDRWRPYLESGLEPEAIVGRYISSPIDIERVMPSMRNGDWNHGEMERPARRVPAVPRVLAVPHRLLERLPARASTWPWADRSAARADTTRRRSSPRTKGSTCGGKAEQSSRAAPVPLYAWIGTGTYIGPELAI